MSDDQKEQARRRGRLGSLHSCRGCGGENTRHERPHPLGGDLVTLECSACGDAIPVVKRDGPRGVTYHKVGRKPRSGL